MNSKNLKGLCEAYNNVYAPQELTEEQVWEEVENWVNSLLEEGYDLSDYTWEEMYEAYIEEQPGFLGLPRFGPSASELQQTSERGKAQREKERSDRATNQRAWLGVVKTDKGYIAKPGATSYDQNKGAEAIRLANRLNKETGLGKPKPVTPLTKPPAPVLPSASSTRSAPTAAASSPRPAAASSPRPAATPAAKPKPAAPTGPAVGKLGSTSFERRTPTSAELRAAQAERATQKASGQDTSSVKNAEKALQAAQKTNLPTTGPTPAIPSAASVSSSMASFKPRDMTKNPLKPTPPTTMKNSYEWGLSANTIKDLANAYNEIYEAKKVDQDQDGDNDFADVRIARLIASGVSKEEAIRRVKDKSYNEEVEIDEATRMRKELGKEGETETRQELAKRSNAYQRSDSVDKTIAGAEAAAGRTTFRKRDESEGDYKTRMQKRSQTLNKLAANRRGSVRDKPRAGLRGYAAKVEGGDRDLQSARGSARSAGTLTPREKKQLNIEAYEAYEFVSSYLLENNFAETLNDANVIIENMSDNWFESIIEEKKPLPVAKMKRKEGKLLDNEEGQLQALRTDVGSKERKARMKELQRFDNINSARTSVAKRGGKQQHPMPEVGRYKPKDED